MIFKFGWFYEDGGFFLYQNFRYVLCSSVAM
jgi:hypothetical protein